MGHLLVRELIVVVVRVLVEGTFDCVLVNECGLGVDQHRNQENEFHHGLLILDNKDQFGMNL